MGHERTPHDASGKAFFSNPDMVASLLRDFAPRALAEELDFATLERCSGAYITDDLRERRSDVVWRVRWKDGWFYVYILLELQSRPDPWMPVRILAYTALLWQELIKTRAVKDGERLPPVFPIVLYNGSTPWIAPLDTAELVTPVGDVLEPYQPRQRCFVIDEGRIPEDVLSDKSGLAGLLLRLERARSAEELVLLLDELSVRLAEPKYLELKTVFMTWLERVVFRRSDVEEPPCRFTSLEEMRDMLAEQVARWKDEYVRQGVLMGRKEGISKGISIGEARGISIGEARGRVEGLRIALRELLETRFETVAPEIASYIENTCDLQALRRLTRLALCADSPEAFLEEAHAVLVVVHGV